MNANIRLGKISSIDYAKGMARVVYHEKDDDVTRLIPLLSHEYKMPPVGSQVLVVHLSNGTEAGVVLGRPWSDKNAPPEGGAFLSLHGRPRTTPASVPLDRWTTRTWDPTGGILYSWDSRGIRRVTSSSFSWYTTLAMPLA